MSNVVFKIRRISDGKFYKGKSKFTTHGSYLRYQQIKECLDWVLCCVEEDNIEIISYKVEEKNIYNIDGKVSKNFIKSIERDKNIDNVLHE